MQLHQNAFGVISHVPELAVIKLVWNENSANMTDEDFKEAQEHLAEFVTVHKAAVVWIDVSKFGHTVRPEIVAWRKVNIIPKYIAAGVRKFVYVDDGASLSPPSGEAREGENFDRRHFNSEEGATAWIKEN